MLLKRILKIKDFVIQQKILLGSLVFFSIFSISLVTFSAPPTNKYAPGATLDPACAPSSTNCSVSVAVGVSDFNTIDSSESPYTVISSDQVIYADSSSGDVEINLPEIASTFKRDIYVIKTSASNSVFVNAYASDYINETTAIELTDNRQSITVESVSTHQWLGTLNFVEYAVSPLAVEAATTAALTTSTYDNGTAGVGATLTDNAPYAVLGNINTVAVAVNDRVLIKNQASGIENGVYVVTSLGVAGSSPWILTRATDSNETAEFDPQVVIPAKGNTTNKGKNFAQTTTNPSIGTDSIAYSLITQAPGTGNVTQKTSGTQATGQIPFWTATARELDKGSSGLFWDNTNKRLGINTASPTGILHIANTAALATTDLFKIVGTQPAVDNATAAGGVSITLAKGSNYSASQYSNGGAFSVTTGAGGNGDLNSSGNGGGFFVTTGNSGSNGGGGSGGDIVFTTGNGSSINDDSGSIYFLGGTTQAGSGMGFDDFGSVTLVGGHNLNVGGAGQGGKIILTGGESDGGQGGNIILDGGVGDTDSLSGVIHVGSQNPQTSLIVGVDEGVSAGNKVKTQLYSSGAQTALNIAAYVNNISTNATTNGIDKYALNVLSTGTYTGLGGAATRNYSIYVNEPTGADENYSIYLAGTGQTRVIDSAAGGYLTNAGVWQGTSSKLLKENYEDLNFEDILAKINQLPVQKWNYIINHDSNIKHIGPYSQDFYEIFQIGDDNEHLNALDTSGVALAGIKALSLKVDGLEAQIGNQGGGISLNDVKDFFASVEEKIIGGLTKMKDLVVETLKIGSPDARTGITFYDETNGSPYCVSIISGAVATVAGECAVIIPPPIPEDNGGGNGNDGGQNNTDTTPPVITLIGDTTITLTIGDIYVESGATAVDDTDGDITGNIVIAGTVDTTIEGSYTVTYNVVDTAGNNAVEVVRTVIVQSVPPPNPPPQEPPPEETPPPQDPPPQE